MLLAPWNTDLTLLLLLVIFSFFMFCHDVCGTITAGGRYFNISSITPHSPLPHFQPVLRDKEGWGSRWLLSITNTNAAQGGWECAGYHVVPPIPRCFPPLHHSSGLCSLHSIHRNCRQLSHPVISHLKLSTQKHTLREYIHIYIYWDFHALLSLCYVCSSMSAMLLCCKLGHWSSVLGGCESVCDGDLQQSLSRN